MKSRSAFRSKLKRLWLHLTPRKRNLFAFAITLSIIGGFAEMISLASLYPFIGIVLSPEEFMDNKFFKEILSFFKLSESSDLRLIITILFITLTFFAALLKVLIIRINTRLAFSSGHDIGVDIFKKTLYQDYINHINSNSSIFTSALTQKIMLLTGYVLLPVLTVFGSIVNILAIVITLLLINFKISIFSFILFGFLYLSIAYISSIRIHKNGEIMASEMTFINKYLQESFGSIQELIIYNSRKYFIEFFSKANRRLRLAQSTNMFLSLSPRYLMEGIGIILIAIFTFFISYTSQNASSFIPLLGVLALGAQRLVPVMQQLFAAWANIKSGEASLDDILDLLDIKSNEHKSELEVNELGFKNTISFKNINFNFNDSQKLVLNDINLEIKKGSVVGLMGVTGSGKTTFVNILMGLLSSSSGEIKIDNTSIDSKNIHLLQNKIAIVPQNIFLADISIAENIGFGRNKSSIDMKRVIDAAKKAEIHEHILSIDGQYESKVGESGVTLSGGQIQRIGIARALYQDKDIIIIDEGTSALDPDTETRVMRSLIDKNKDSTLFLIAHRLTTLLNCDEVINFDDGKITKIYNKKDFEKFINTTSFNE